jgi:DNA-binding XRE family transcriptional regulator
VPEQRKARAPGVPFETVLSEHLKDPKVARAYEELGPEFEIISQVIALRNKRKMTQAQLAERVGTKQPSIARLEKRGTAKDLEFLQRVAIALDARLEVRLVPRQSKGVTKRASRSSPRHPARAKLT